MTVYVTHRFSVGQPVTHSAHPLIFCEVIAQIGGADRPEYRIRSFDGGFETQAPERELAYTTAPPPRRSRIAVH